MGMDPDPSPQAEDELRVLGIWNLDCGGQVVKDRLMVDRIPAVKPAVNKLRDGVRRWIGGGSKTRTGSGRKRPMVICPPRRGLAAIVPNEFGACVALGLPPPQPTTRAAP